MKIGEREVHFAYTVGAYCDINDYVVANPDVSAATANLYKAVYMNRAYNEMHGGGEEVTVEELRHLPGYMMKELLDEMAEAEAEGSKRTVETEEKKPVKAGKA